MDAQLEIIRASLAEGADEQSRAAGAAACRAVLATLVPHEPTTIDAPTPPPANALPAELAAMFAMLKNVPVDQLLDLAINRLRAALPAGAVVAPSGPTLKFHLLPTPPMRRKP